MNAIGSVLAAVLTAAVLSAGCGGLESAAERGAHRAAGEKIDRTFKGGGVANQAAQAYAKNIRFELRAVRASKDKIVVSGLVGNDGARTVTYMKVHISLQDKDGVEVGGRTDLFAHNQLFGDNNTPIRPRSAKHVTCPISNSSWPGGRMTISVTEIAIK
ncbi:MAG: hypothetical protein QGH94_13370 [Phycisphaerae bacterium]|jgi:hypothetical protein|nr:hypothetical protein [Phycisphaerae bacterium]MDP7288970.1 hypothetical protein [Phycisphaerae bacterium]